MHEPEEGIRQPPEEGVSETEEAPGQPAENEGMVAWLEEHEAGRRSPRRDDVVDGVVVRIDRDEVLVDIGAKSEAIIPIHQIPPQERVALQVGDQLIAVVIRSEDQEGRAVLSVSRAQAERNWRALEKHCEAGDILSGKVVEFNKGGLIVNVLGARGFLPLSQVADLHRGDGTEPSIDERLRAHTGRDVQVKVIEISRKRNRLILSERAAVLVRRAHEKERLLEELQPGDVRQGVISSVCDFGAFVDLGGADGLIHITELSWGQVAHPREVVKVREPVNVRVLSVDREKKKIALSLKRMQAEPWTLVAETYQAGDLVRARVTKLAAFGAFAQLDEGIEGLIHISELADERITHPKQVVQEGDRVHVRILRIDSARRRLGLSLRQGGYVDEPIAPAEAPEIPEPARTLETSEPAELRQTFEATQVLETTETAEVTASAEPVVSAEEFVGPGYRTTEPADEPLAEPAKAADEPGVETFEPAETAIQLAQAVEKPSNGTEVAQTESVLLQEAEGSVEAQLPVQTKPEDRLSEGNGTAGDTEPSSEMDEPVARNT